MGRIILLFSHKLLENQIEELKNKYDVNEIIYLNEELQSYWTNVDIERDYFNNLELIKKFVDNNLRKGDYILIQGEWGYTYNMIEYSKNKGYIPIYSFSKREAVEKNEGDKIIKTSIFKHICFFKY